MSPIDSLARIGWVILTMGDRPDLLAEAVVSTLDTLNCAQVVVVANGTSSQQVAALLPEDPRLAVVESGANLGVPGGRHFGIGHLSADIEFIGFLDDDARIISLDVDASIGRAFSVENTAVVSLRIVDATGSSARRHVPRPGSSSADRGGMVATFLGGACVIRRSWYLAAGGYWIDLWYGHEELDLAWRIADAGGSIEYLAEVQVEHPRSDIERHADGWRLTGRNRVMVGRRNLPWGVCLVHTSVWLAVGWWRAPRACRSAYFSGWRSGWTESVPRNPIRWATVWNLTRLGRPPVF
jgi:GT2 family glycosyltransferase